MPASGWLEILPNDSGRALSAWPPRTSGRQCISPTAILRKSCSTRRPPPSRSDCRNSRRSFAPPSRSARRRWSGAPPARCRCHYMLQQARAADIIVVGARAETMVDPSAAPDPSDLVMQAGRPLIVVPSAVQWLDLRSVLVAWKDVREARRAVFDALPILAAAKEVTIAEIPEQDTHRADAVSRVADVAAWLRSHGIAATHDRSRKARRGQRTTRKDRRQCRRRRRDCRRLWPLALPRMGAQWRYPPPCN